MVTEFAFNDVITKMQSALTEYINWQSRTRTNNERANMASGFFSWLRHGSRGIADAKKFVDNIKSAESAQAAAAVINEFLSAQVSKGSPRTFHRHAFVSFVLDQLAEFKGLESISDYKSILKNESGMYDNLVYEEVFKGFNDNLQKPLQKKDVVTSLC